MLTQCPHCLTLFRVGPEQLRAAEGQVRCCRCHQVFNALESLHETPSSFTSPPLHEPEEDLESPPDSELETIPDPADPVPETSSARDDWLLTQEDAPETPFEPILPSLEREEESQAELDEFLEQDDGLEPAPDYLDIGTESQMSELLDQDSSSLLLPDSESLPFENPEEEESPVESAKVVSFTGPTQPQPSAQDEADTEEEEELEPSEDEKAFEASDFEDSILKDQAIDEELGKPDYDSVPALRDDEETTEPQTGDDRALRFEAEESPRPKSRLNRNWLIACLLLLIPLSGQLLWHFRDNLIHYAAGRQALGLVCTVAGCQVPERRDLERIIISGRNLSTHPDKPDTLQLQLSLVNTAPFEQPFPQLTLSLFNDNGSLIARRTFTTDQYMPEQNNQKQLMPKAQTVLVELDLVDPGNEVTGFSFDFY